MMITLEAGVLSKALKFAASVVEARNTIPILSNVSLFADGDTLEIVSTNLDVEFAQRLECATGGKLATTVDARRFSAIVGAADSGGQIKLELEDGRLLVRAGRGRWQMPVLPRDDFPRVKFDDAPHSITVPSADLANVLGAVLWSVEKGEARYYLQGPLLHGDDGNCALVATNGHTVAHVTTALDWPEEAPEIILSPKWCNLIERYAAEAGDPIDLAWNDKAIRAQIGEVTLIGKVIDGTFPDYRRVVPQPGEPMLVGPSEMQGALRRVMVISGEKTRIVRLTPRDGICEISSSDTSNGTARFEVSCGTPWSHETGVNGDYLASMLSAVGGDQVEIHQADAGNQMLIRRPDGGDVYGVVMPCRI